jgi:O-methyltransferase involved in polyketide biosynthesis
MCRSILKPKLFHRAEASAFDWMLIRSLHGLGQPQYLTREAVISTIGEIATLAASRSEVVVQFITPASSIPETDAAISKTLAERSARSGEPWLSHFTPADMEEIFRNVGSKGIEHFGAAEATSSYLQARMARASLPILG